MKRRKIIFVITIVFLAAGTELFAASRLLYENFDDGVLDSRLWARVYGAIAAPPQYGLASPGRGGTGSSFSSGTVAATWVQWPSANMTKPWPSDEMYVSFWMKYSKFVRTEQHENIKIFYPHWNGISSYVHYCLSNTDLIYYSANSFDKAIDGGVWLTCPGQADGRWHRYEFYIKFSAGISRFWYDGVLKLDRTYGPGKWTNDVNGIDAPSMDAGNPSSFSRQIDDLEIWTGMPASTSTPANPVGRDTTPPYGTGLNPAAGATNVPVNANIILHLKDSGSGVDKSTIVMTVNGVRVYPTITGTPADYTLFYNPPVNFAYGSRVYVKVNVKDLSGNSIGPNSYSFVTSRSRYSDASLIAPAGAAVRIM